MEIVYKFSYFKQSLVPEFLAQNPFCQSDCLILLTGISPEWHGLLASFFARQSSIMMETN